MGSQRGRDRRVPKPRRSTTIFRYDEAQLESRQGAQVEPHCYLGTTHALCVYVRMKPNIKTAVPSWRRWTANVTHVLGKSTNACWAQNWASKHAQKGEMCLHPLVGSFPPFAFHPFGRRLRDMCSPTTEAGSWRKCADPAGAVEPLLKGPSWRR